MAEDPLTTHARNRVGRVLRNKWTLDRLIGVGGMAAVYEATHRNGSKVAIKILHPTLMYDTNFAHRLIQEGYVANKINHPAAVKVFDDDADETDGAVFLVMELLEGMTLSQARRKRKKFPAVEAFKMLDPVLECLGNAHERGIIHRDIKPENLFVTRDGAVRVLDFGIARINDGSNVSTTRTGMVVGSPAYMSPEQALGKMNSVGPQTDVYAVGATLFALISGTTPHAGESTQEMIVMVATQAARPINTVVADLPPAVARVIDRALAYDKDKRYPDARAMLADMRAAVQEIEGPSSRVLPTFADDDDEGQTTVNNALKNTGSDSKPGAGAAAAPLPAAGLNRVGSRPQTGKFSVPVTAAEPVSPAPNASAPPGAPPSPANVFKPRAPTLAPTGAPSPMLGQAPLAPQSPSGQSSGQFGAAPGSGPHAAAPPGSISGLNAPFQPSGPMPGGDPLNAPVTSGVPPTMAIPVINPIDLMGSGTPGSNSGQQPFPQMDAQPGATSGQRPGATTNMAWAAPDASAAPPEAPPRKPKTALFVGGAVAALAIGVAAFFGLSGGNETPAPAPVARPARPQPPVVQTPPAVNTPPATPPVVAAADAAAAAPVVADAAVAVAAPAEAADAAAAPVVAANTPPEATPPASDPPASDPPASDPPAANARTDRRRDRPRAAAPSGGNTGGSAGGGRRRGRGRTTNANPLGY